MKTYSLRKATVGRLVVPILVAILITASSAVWLSNRAIGLLRDDQMQQESAFLLLLARHEATEGEQIGLIRTVESLQLQQFLGARSSFRIWSGAALVTHSTPAAGLPQRASQPGFSTRRFNGENWRTFAITQPGTKITVEVWEPMMIRNAMTFQVVGSLALPLTFLLLAVVAIVYALINREMRPMRDISRDLEARQPEDYRPLSGYRIPEEVAPLFIAFNKLMTSFGALIAREREFTDNAAHELRTPLAVLKTRAQIVARDLEADPARRQHVLQLVEATDRATGTLDQLLMLSRAGVMPHPTTPVDISALVETVCRETASAAIAKHQHFGVDIQPGLVIAGQPDMLAMLIGNLVGNAIRHSPAGSDIAVSLDQAPAGAVRLRVSDTGPGIPAEQYNTAFDRFQRLGSAEPGSGLGLAIARRIALQHSSSITLSDNKPHGLCVEMLLPGHDSAQQTPVA